MKVTAGEKEQLVMAMLTFLVVHSGRNIRQSG